MYFKKHFTYKLGKNDPLRLIFPNGILPNGFINKGRCAIGGTTLEIENETRCSIITVPNISILKSKKAQHPNIDIVYGDIPYEEVLGYLEKKKQGQKIMTTPEGVKKIMKAANALGRTQELHEEWFFMLDESHTFITEHYRDDILKPFEHFFNFKNKCIISATPYFFSHPKIAELDYHEVIITEKLGDVLLVDCISITATVLKLLKQADDLKGNIHIFFNSVTEIAKVVKLANLTEVNCAIFCADDKSKKNMVTLGELKNLYREQPDETTFKKINFYTCKYFEGWDMYDENATLVVVTNVHKEHTKIGIADKALQAFGRLRGKKGTLEPSKPYLQIHITNHSYNRNMRTHKEIETTYAYQADINIARHNQDIKDEAITDLVIDTRVKRVSDIDKKTNVATLHHFKLDQFINETSTTEVYNHINFIEQVWDNKFNVRKIYSDTRLETTTAIKRKSANKEFKEDYEQLIANEQSKCNGVIKFSFGVDIEDVINKRNPLAYKAFKLLDETTVINLKHNRKKVELELITKQNELAEIRLLRMLDLNFKVGQRYSNAVIKATLQDFFNKLEIKTKAGKIITAEPAQLGYDGRFEIEDAKWKDDKGIEQRGYRIVRKQFDMVVAA